MEHILIVRPRLPGVPTLRCSLLEMLIVVAIFAAAVGVAVPMCQKNIVESFRAKSMQDLDTLRSAITLHDSQNAPLTGMNSAPLLGRYLQEIPRDPWGNEYLISTDAGVIISFGADQKPRGDGDDEDLIVAYRTR